MNSKQSKKIIEGAVQRSTTCLGYRESILGVEGQIELSERQRLSHVLTAGPTDTGKSLGLEHTAVQDAYQGRGLCIINPKGDLIDDFLSKLPRRRRGDVIYINPADSGVPRINPLKPYIDERMSLVQKENQKEIIVSDVVDLFKRRSENWGDRFGRILETLIRAYLDLNIKNGTEYSLVDVYRAVVDQSVLTDLIDSTDDRVVREQLVRVKEDLSSSQLEPLQRRLNDFVMNPSVRRIIGAEGAGLDFREALDEQKIILVDVQKGEVGGTVSEIMGSIVITQIWAAAQSRITQPIDQRQPFFLFVDELQNFSGEGSNFAKILSEAREYRLGCWLVTQFLQQLPSDMRRAVANNCRTKIFFNPQGSEHLPQIKGMLQGVEYPQLTALRQYQAVVQRPMNGDQGSATFLRTYPPWESDRSHVERIKQQSNQPGMDDTVVEVRPSLGPGWNSGGEKHRELLLEAEKLLIDQGCEVKLLYQDAGSDSPDGVVTLPNGEIAHLEAESGTLSKPGKVLKNLHRAALLDRETIFVVQLGDAEKLENILSDPVNRHNQSESEDGFSYYQLDGEPFEAVDEISDARYRIIEIDQDTDSSEDQTDLESTKDPWQGKLRETDRIVLDSIHQGRDDVQKITSTTDLENHEVNYCFTKLEKLGLIKVEKPEGMIERYIDGQKRVFEAPKVGKLTRQGERLLE